MHFTGDNAVKFAAVFEYSEKFFVVKRSKKVNCRVDAVVGYGD